MQGPQHRRYTRAIVRLSIVLLALLALSGCREDRDGSERRSAAKYQRMLDSSGKRVLIVDSDGQPVAKLRKRNNKYKVYDAQLTPVGFVSWSAADESESAAPDSREVIVSVRSMGRDDAQAIEEVAERTYELGGELRIEQTNRGWAVFGSDAKLVGVFQHTDTDQWRLRQSYEDGAVIEAKTAGSRRLLTRKDETILTMQVGDLSALELLAVKLDGLSMLHRVAVGVWMERARPNSH